jgi:hypothetical protein
MSITINPNGTLNLGTNGKIQATNIDLSGSWSNAPSGTVITVARGTLGSTFSTSSDSNVYTGLATSALVRKMPGGTGAGKSSIHIYCMGGNRDANNDQKQDVTILYRSIGGASDSEIAYMDANHYGGFWGPHAGYHVDTSTMNAGSSLVYKMYQRSRGGGSTVYFHNVTGGVSGNCHLIAQEIVN